MCRISVVGVPGSGKTSVGRHLATSLDVPFFELDSVFHQPDWAELSRPEFRARVAEAVAGDGWVVDGNYSAVQDLVWQRADTVVWLDLPRRLVTFRVIRRTLRRVMTRERRWNDNREPISNLYRLDPEKSIIAWTCVKHPEYIERYGAAMRDSAYGHVRFVRLRSEREISAFISGAPSGGESGV